ncbi:hypothetical protein D3C80_2184080 [compost metagenome]
MGGDAVGRAGVQRVGATDDLQGRAIAIRIAEGIRLGVFIAASEIQAVLKQVDAAGQAGPNLISIAAI